MKKCINLKNRNGVTLVELLVVLGIIGIVAIIAFSIYLFSARTYAKGTDQSSAQFDVRMTADYITREVRYATEVEILNGAADVPAIITSDDIYIFAGTANGNIIYRDSSGSRTIAGEISGDMIFEKKTLSKLYFNITGNYTGQNFDINSEVAVLNLPKTGAIICNTGTGFGKAIRYKKTTGSAVGPLSLGNIKTYGYIGQSYSSQIEVKQGKSPYAFSLVNGTIPNGISLSTDGLLSGTPTEAGYFEFVIKVEDDSLLKLSSTRTYTIIIYSTNTAQSIANSINSTPEPIKLLPGDTSITLPDVPADYRITIESVNPGGIIDLTTGAITPPASDTTVVLVLRITNIFSASDTAVTSEINIAVPSASSNKAPVASNVTVSGMTQAGSVLNGSYTYSDPEGDSEGTTKLKWYRGNKEDGSGRILAAEGSNTYTIVEADAGMYMFFEVTPVAQTGYLEGIPVLSPPTLMVISANVPPSATSVKIEGLDVVGSTLTGKYIYQHYGLNDEGFSIYKWYRSEKNNGSDKVQIVGALDKEYILTDQDKDKYIYFEITPVALNGDAKTGVPVLSGNIGKIK